MDPISRSNLVEDSDANHGKCQSPNRQLSQKARNKPRENQRDQPRAVLVCFRPRARGGTRLANCRWLLRFYKGERRYARIFLALADDGDRKADGKLVYDYEMAKAAAEKHH